jgi:hypothetical protein
MNKKKKKKIKKILTQVFNPLKFIKKKKKKNLLWSQS